jgi:hypothetical protein
MSAHSPLPFRHEENSDEVLDGASRLVADVFGSDPGLQAANAKFIAQACNAFDGLIEVVARYEALEVKLVVTNEAWERSLPTLTQGIFDELIEIQTLRNVVLRKAGLR